MAFDLKLEETGNGGDAVLSGNDLEIVLGWENMPYMALFGGNPGFITPRVRATDEQAGDFWGNLIFHRDDPGIQFNSRTEHVLNNVTLNSEGRLQIEEAAKKDLEFMSDFATVNVTATIPTVDRVDIVLEIARLDNLEEKQFIFIWDATEAALIAAEIN